MGAIGLLAMPVHHERMVPDLEPQPRRDRVLSAGEKARMLHGRWLTRALAHPRERWPLIPLRRVAEGGFAALMTHPNGRAWAEAWWDATLAVLPEEP